MSRYASVEVLQCEIQTLCDKYSIKPDFKRYLLRLIEEVPSVEYSAMEALEHSADIVTPKNSAHSNKHKVKTSKPIQTIPCQKEQTHLEVRYEKTKYGYLAWVCKYGNIISQSTLSPERCFWIQMKKLKAKGVDISTISPEPIIINEEKNDYEHSSNG